MNMTHPLAGRPAPKEILIDPVKLERDYHENKPDMGNPAQRVAFGTSGHRGQPADGSFTESHILAIVQAVCDYRTMRGHTGPLYLGKDTHAASGPAQRTAIEVLTANEVRTVYQEKDGYTPTPVISHAILGHNRTETGGQADGIVITPSHNPPGDGGIKYNPPTGGPADTEVTKWIQDRANALLEGKNNLVRRIPYETALGSPHLKAVDFAESYIADLPSLIDLEAIRLSKIRIGVDPLGGAGTAYWKPIAEKYGLDITVVNDRVDPTFSFMTLDHDGKIRMDCSSSHAMRGLVALKDTFDIAFANDPDTDRHGIVCPSCGLMNPNHYLAVAIRYLFQHRPAWNNKVGIGKTLVSSAMIDRVAADIGRALVEVPVGFKWFVDGLFTGSLGFGGEESAGASFLRSDGTVWTTDKDGIVLNLLAAEILATVGCDPGVLYEEMETRFGKSYYTRVDQEATPRQKAVLLKMAPENVAATELAGEPITARLTTAPGNGASIGGLKVCAQNGWFAARPSGTENIYKIYAESFRSDAHLDRILREAKSIVDGVVAGA